MRKGKPMRNIKIKPMTLSSSYMERRKRINHVALFLAVFILCWDILAVKAALVAMQRQAEVAARV